MPVPDASSTAVPVSSSPLAKAQRVALIAQGTAPATAHLPASGQGFGDLPAAVYQLHQVQHHRFLLNLSTGMVSGFYLAHQRQHGSFTSGGQREAKAARRTWPAHGWLIFRSWLFRLLAFWLLAIT